MFKKRGLLVQLAEAKTDEEMAERRLDNLDRALLIRRVADETMKVIGFYFAAHTLRGVITHVVVTKVGPPVIIEAVKEN